MRAWPRAQTLVPSLPSPMRHASPRRPRGNWRIKKACLGQSVLVQTSSFHFASGRCWCTALHGIDVTAHRRNIPARVQEKKISRAPQIPHRSRHPFTSRQDRHAPVFPSCASPDSRPPHVPSAARPPFMQSTDPLRFLFSRPSKLVPRRPSCRVTPPLTGLARPR